MNYMAVMKLVTAMIFLGINAVVKAGPMEGRTWLSHAQALLACPGHMKRQSAAVAVPLAHLSFVPLRVFVALVETLGVLGGDLIRT